MREIYKTIIVDDEPGSIQVLAEALSLHPDVEIVGTSASQEQSKALIVEKQPDLLFLDVEMAGMNGFELLNSIYNQIRNDMYVVIYTAYDKYLIDAVRTSSAFDYLLKPVTDEKLNQVMEHVRTTPPHGSIDMRYSLQTFLANSGKFVITTPKGPLFLAPADVLYFIRKGNNWHVRCYTSDSEWKLSAGTSAERLAALNPAFMKVKPDLVLNISHLMSIENGSNRCILSPPYQDEVIIASRRYCKQIKDALIFFMTT